MSGAERVFELLRREGRRGRRGPSLDGPSSPRTCRRFELDHVTFGYKPGVTVLHDVCLSVARGEKIALVGATGAGRATVASLALRLYDATEGAVRVFGEDVKGADRVAMRELFAVVPQDVFLFAGTVLATSHLRRPTRPRPRRGGPPKIGALELFERRGGLDARVDERGRTSAPASDSSWRSRAPSTATRRSSCSTRRRPASTRTPRRRCRRPSTPS
jgi:ATP-binding cassette subfamily B multidrug efflux pump